MHTHAHSIQGPVTVFTWLNATMLITIVHMTTIQTQPLPDV